MNSRQLKTIILVGSRDFGRCPIASRLLTALWPVAGKPVLERLLAHLASQGIDQVTICSGGDANLLAESIQIDNRLAVEFVDEQLPTGTAGSIRNAVRGQSNDLLLVLPASMVNPPRIDGLVNAHRDGGSELTIMFNPGYGDGRAIGDPADIYVCEAGILEHVPKAGYFDIKEGLIPEMLRAGETIHAAVLPRHAGNFRDRHGYIGAVGNYTENVQQEKAEQRHVKRADSQSASIAANVTIDPRARLYGPVAIMDGACVAEDAVIIGPTVLGENVRIERQCVVANSIIWDGAHVGPNCRIQRCLIDYHATVRQSTIAAEESIPLRRKGTTQTLLRGVSRVSRSYIGKLQGVLQGPLDRISAILPSWVRLRQRRLIPLFGAISVLIAFVWCYWDGIAELWKIWQRSDEYSSGLLVPFLTVYVLWSRRHSLAQCPVKPCIWGLFLLVIAQAGRLFGLFFMYSSAENLSLVLSIAALVLLLLGWKLFRKVFTVLVFLGLMLPWPNRIQAAIALPLQRWATSSSVFCLEMIGYDVMQEGNLIHVGSATVAVAEACNGLRMITAFFVISGLVVLLVRRAWWKKLVILASSLPIALLCNTVRLTITAMAFTVLEGKHWEKIFHDFGGYAMMPLALAIVVAELWLLARLTTLPAKEEAIVITRRSAG